MKRVWQQIPVHLGIIAQHVTGTTQKASSTIPAGLSSDDNNASAGAITVPAGIEAVAGRPDSPADETRPCPRCGATLPEMFNFCGACGFNLSAKDGRAYRDPLIGVVVGDRYRLLSRIGVGGMGTVYKAEHVHIGKVVAVKLLHGDLSRDEAMIRRFTREARAASKLSNPHTVSVFDYGQSDGLVYLVMEFLQGRDLGQVLAKDGILGPDQTITVVAQVAESLSEAHLYGIVHRDLKPENIFLCTNKDRIEMVKVLDFGLAKLRETHDENSLVKTAKGDLVGTPFYMSPEQIAGQDVDLRSDVYSLGAVIYKLLTGRPPFDHHNPVAVLSKHLTEAPPLLSDFDVSLTPFDATVQKALAKKPEDRFQSIGALSRSLIQSTSSKPGRVSTEMPAMRLHRLPDEVVSTRRDFDRYERSLRRRRTGTTLFFLLLVASAVGLFMWEYVLPKDTGPADLEHEPNNDPETANVLFEEMTLRGFIGEPTLGERADVDFFRVDNPGGRPSVIRIALEGVPGLDLVVKAYDPNGREILAINGRGESEGELIPNFPLSSQYIYLMVREYWVRNRTARQNTVDPYRLSISTREFWENEEVEPNNGLLRALQLRNGVIARGLLHARDLDFYRSPELDGPTMVRVSLTGPDAMDTELVLVDISAQELFRVDRRGAGEGEEVVFFAAPFAENPAFYVGVMELNEEGPGNENPYQLTVEFTPPADFELPASLLEQLERLDNEGSESE